MRGVSCSRAAGKAAVAAVVSDAGGWGGGAQGWSGTQGLAGAEVGTGGGSGWAGGGAEWADDVYLSGMGELRTVCYDIVTILDKIVIASRWIATASPRNDGLFDDASNSKLPSGHANGQEWIKFFCFFLFTKRRPCFPLPLFL